MQPALDRTLELTRGRAEQAERLSAAPEPLRAATFPDTVEARP
jgi:hypothetical protein